jgi:hypothetical protein
MMKIKKTDGGFIPSTGHSKKAVTCLKATEYKQFPPKGPNV